MQLYNAKLIEESLLLRCIAYRSHFENSEELWLIEEVGIVNNPMYQSFTGVLGDYLSIFISKKG